MLVLANGSLSHSLGRQDAERRCDPDAEPRRRSTTSSWAQTSFDDATAGNAIESTGNVAAVQELLSLLDTFEFWFNIVTP